MQDSCKNESLRCDCSLLGVGRPLDVYLDSKKDLHISVTIPSDLKTTELTVSSDSILDQLAEQNKLRTPVAKIYTAILGDLTGICFEPTALHFARQNWQNMATREDLLFLLNIIHTSRRLFNFAVP